MGDLEDAIMALEETIAELRAELTEMTIFRDNAVANQKDYEDMFIDIKSNYDIFVRHNRRPVE